VTEHKDPALLTEAELVELGLYDPEAPVAAERLELLRLAFEYGATIEEARQGIDERRLHAIAAVRVVLGGTERLTLNEAAQRAGVEPDVARRFWRALGLSDPEEGMRPCSERDVDALATLEAIRLGISEDAALQIARATGTAMARLADSEVSMIRAAEEAPLRGSGGGNVEVAESLLHAASTYLAAMLPLIDSVHRHHVAASGRRYSGWGVGPTERSTTDAVVGFADLVGFTSLAQSLDTTELDALLRRFEARALDATRRPLARLVKLIGDEAMFVAGDTADAIDIVRAIGDAELPQLRAGVAAGVLVVREGDVFGPVVNLAARLVKQAEPGQVLLDAEAALRLGTGKVEPLGARVLAGIEGPVEVFAAR
jgi:adenylate cyclase